MNYTFRITATDTQFTVSDEVTVVVGSGREVEGVRTGQHRAGAGRRLDQVLPAQRREAAAQQRDVGQAVVLRHLAQ